jgi:uncharacterized protein (TIGR02722 family)
MKTKIIIPFITAVGMVFIVTGCGTPAHYVQTGDNEQIVNVGQINIQDYAAAAHDAITNLVASGALDKVSMPPAVLFVSGIINNTGQQIDTDLLTKKISIALLNTGKAQTTSTDPTANGLHGRDVFLNGQNAARMPDFTLSGKIIETIDRAGNTSRHTYSFQLSLNDTKTGYQVWEGETEIGKQGTRGSVRAW